MLIIEKSSCLEDFFSALVKRGAFAYNPARVNIGSLGRNEYDFDGCVSPVYIVFECKDGYANYFDLYRTTERFKTEVLLRAIGGVRQSLNYTDFAMIQTIIAPQETIDAFNPMFEKIKVTQKHLETENNRLAELRDTLLPKLMSGKDIYFNIERLYHGTNLTLFNMSNDDRMQFLSDCVMVIRYLYPYYKPLIVDNTLSILYGDAMSQKVGWYLCGEIYDNLEIVEKRNLTSIDYDFNQIYLTNLYPLAYKYGHSFAGCELGEIAYSLIQGAEVIGFENYLSDENIRNAIERIKDFVKNKKEDYYVIVSFDKNDLDISALELIEDGFKDDLLDFDTWQTSLMLNTPDFDNFGYILKYSKPLDFNQYGIENGKEEQQEALKRLFEHSKKEEE